MDGFLGRLTARGILGVRAFVMPCHLDCLSNLLGRLPPEGNGVWDARACGAPDHLARLAIRGAWKFEFGMPGHLRRLGIWDAKAFEMLKWPAPIT